MTIEEIRKFIADNKDTEDVKGLIQELAPEVDEAAIIEKYKVSQEFMSEIDRNVTKSVKTFENNFMENKLPGIVDERVKVLNPKETSLEKEVRELKAERAQEKKEQAKEKLTNQAMKKFNEKGMPLEAIDLLHFESEEDIDKKADLFNKLFSEKVTAGIDEKIKTAGITGEPPKSKGTGTGIITSQDGLKGMKPSEIVKANSEGRIQIPGYGSPS